MSRRPQSRSELERALLTQLRLLETLLQPGTVVMFTGDNGGVTSLEWKQRPVTSNLPLRSGKGNVYEGGIRVPTIIRWPGVTRAGSTSHEPVVSYDFAPTLAEIAGVTAPPAFDGRSLTGVLRRQQHLDRDLFWHYPHYSPQLGKPAAAIRHGNDKLILFFEDSRVELYNLKDDLGELKDLSAAQPAKAAAMRRRLENWLRDTGAQIPQPNPNYDPAREREEGEPSGPVTAK